MFAPKTGYEATVESELKVNIYRLVAWTQIYTVPPAWIGETIVACVACACSLYWFWYLRGGSLSARLPNTANPAPGRHFLMKKKWAIRFSHKVPPGWPLWGCYDGGRISLEFARLQTMTERQWETESALWSVGEGISPPDRLTQTHPDNWHVFHEPTGHMSGIWIT